MRASHLALGAALLGALLVSACDRKEVPTTTAADDDAAQKSKAWVTFRDNYIEEFFKAHPTAAVGAGRHEFDGQLPDWSAEGIANEIKRLHAARDQAAAFTELPADAEFERDYLIARIDRTSGEAKTIEPPTKGQGARRVWSDSKGRIWVSEWNSGQVSVYDPRVATSPCYACVFPPDATVEEVRCATMGVFAPLVGIVGTLQAAEALKLLAGIGRPMVGRLQMLDVRSMEWTEVRLVRAAGCPVCGARMPLRSPN